MGESDDEKEVSGHEFDPIDPRKIKYILPGNNTLSMLMEACIALKSFSAAQDYWGLLTDPSGEYSITPDAENYHVYLRRLRMKRASKVSVEMLEELCYNPPGGIKVLQPKTFRIAMSTCLRDVNNPNVLAHANKMARIMLDSLEKPDILALSMYLRLALTDRHLRWESLMEVLRGCEIGVRNLRSFLSYGEEKNMGSRHEDEEEAAIQFVTKLARAFQAAMSLGKGRMSLEEEKFCKVEGHKLSEWALRMRKMRRGRARQEEKRGYDQGERGNEEEGNNPGRSLDEITETDGSTEGVDAVDRGKRGLDSRPRPSMVSDNQGFRWIMYRNNQKPPEVDKSDDVRTEDPHSNEAKKKPYLGRNYRPSCIHNIRKTLAHQTRMQMRSAESRQRLRAKIDEDENW